MILCLSVLTFSCTKESPQEGGGEGNQIAPNFKLKQIDGESISLKKYRGKYVLLNFWATWCHPCISEMPLFQKEYQKWLPGDLVFLAINAGENANTVRGFMQRYSYTFPVLLDENNEMAVKYHLKFFPTTILIDKNGTIIKKHIGALEDEAMIAKEILSQIPSLALGNQ